LLGVGTLSNLWLCDLLSDVWHEQPLNELVEALAPNIFVHSFPLFIMVEVFTVPYPPEVYAASVKFLPVAYWIHGSRGWNF